jgi:transcriptional regulator with XRE-family HTH domain
MYGTLRRDVGPVNTPHDMSAGLQLTGRIAGRSIRCPDAPGRGLAASGDDPLNDAAGDRLRAYISGLMADRGIPSVSELARRAHVSRDTFQAWWRGRPPQRSTAEIVARELGVTYADLIAAREGTAPGTSDGPGAVALTQLTAAINRLAAALEGRTDDLGAAVEEGIAQASTRDAEAPTPHGRSPE